MLELFDTILYEPILNLLVMLYNVTGSIGIAIILLTLIIKVILWPLNTKALKSQRALAELQPEIDDLKRKYKDNKEEQSREMMALYSKQKVSPFSSCLPILIQLPILFALYRVMRDGLKSEGLDHLYNFVANPGTIDAMFLGMNLAEASIILAVLAGLAQFWQAKMMYRRRPPEKLRKRQGAKDENLMATMNKQMVYFMPVITVIIGIQLPGGLTLYWLMNNIFTIIQQYITFRGLEKEKIISKDNNGETPKKPESKPLEIEKPKEDIPAPQKDDDKTSNQ